ncbi:MAG: hypothetical protein D6741_17400, partial [Planctomycetota bacterium]
MTTETKTGFDENAFEAFLASRHDEPQWLIERRKEAWAAYNELPFPNSRMEEWRRTDMRAFSLDRFAPPASTTDLPVPAGVFTERFTAA